MPPCLANHPNTSRRELLVGRRELLQVSVEKGETQVREFLQENTNPLQSTSKAILLKKLKKKKKKKKKNLLGKILAHDIEKR
jgi:hypothetical protein